MLAFILNHFSRRLAALPRERALLRGRQLGWFVGRVVRFRRGYALAALRDAFPERSPPELREIVDGMYANLGMTVVELARVSVLGLSDLEGHVNNEGLAEMERLNEEEGGSFFLMGHIGNWECGAHAMQAVEQLRHVVVKPIRNKALNNYIVHLRQKMDLHLLPAKDSFRECLRKISEGHHITIVLDQNTKRKNGIFVDFFGKQACTTAGLAILAARTRRPVRLLYDIRQKDHSHLFSMTPPLEAPANTSPEEIRSATQRYTKALEDVIRKYPEQWIWIHRRWRTQPKSNVERLETPAVEA